MNLSRFNQVLILLCVFFAGICLVITCNNCTDYTRQTQTTVQVQQAPPPFQDYGNYQVVSQGSDQVVIVRDDWSGEEFYLSYVLWSQLGGYNGAISYYRSHRYDPGWSTQQSNYYSTASTTINNYYHQQDQPVDKAKPLSEQIKFYPSAGFSKPKSTESAPAVSTTKNSTPAPPGYQPSKGFGRWFDSEDRPATTTAEPVTYQPSNGFSKPGGSATESSQPPTGYRPSSGFSKPAKSEPAPTGYQPSKGFSKPTPAPTGYQPSKGFSKPTPPPDGYKPSKGFGKKKE